MTRPPVAVPAPPTRSEQLQEYNNQLSQLVIMRNQLPSDMQRGLNDCIAKVSGDVRAFMMCENLDDLSS